MKKIYFGLLAVGMLAAFNSFAFDGIMNSSSMQLLNQHQKLAFSCTSPELFKSKHNILKSEGGGNSFAQGKIVISAGYGGPNLGKAVVNAIISDSATNVKATGMGPIHFKVEYGLSDGVGFGLSVNYMSFGVKFTELPYDYTFSRSSLSLLARINFHFGTTEQLDPYFGVGAGYRQATWKFESTDPTYTGESIAGFSPFGFETTIGLRYYFTEGFGIYTEMGIAKSIIQGGLVVSF